MLETGEFERVGSSKTHKVDARVLSATNADLQAEVAEGKFRQDFAFSPQHRRNSHSTPQRTARRYSSASGIILRQHGNRYRRELEGFTPGAIEALMQHAGKANVHESDHM